MDVFLAITCAKLALEGSTEECAWLQHLFNVISDNIYKTSFFDESCEEICLDVVNIVLKNNDNKLPTNHTVLSASSLYAFEEGKYFTGKFGQHSQPLTESAEITEYNVLEEKRMILIGFLTDNPKSDKTLHKEAGFLYLEDNKKGIICEFCEESKPEKWHINSLVLIPKWNFIDICFPVLIFESDRRRSSRNRLKYIEVGESLISYSQKQEYLAVPKAALSVKAFIANKEIVNNKINIVGCLTSLSSSAVVTGQKPRFLAQFSSPENEHSAAVVFSGYEFICWYGLMTVGHTYVITQVCKRTINKGQANEREILTATKNSDFNKVDPQTYRAKERYSPECHQRPKHQGKTCVKTDKQESKRKQDDTEKESDEMVSVKRCKKEQESHFTQILPLKIDGYSCSELIQYEGLITAVVNSDVGLYEIDNKFRLYTQYMPITNFGCGFRVGASVILYNIHLCKLGQKVLGLVCCNSSTMRVNKFSVLDSPFQYWISGASYLFSLVLSLSLLDFIKAIDLCDMLTNKFKSHLKYTDVIGPKKFWKRVAPTILSHVVDLQSMTSSSLHDMCDVFFSNPHHCIVTTPLSHVIIPTSLALKDVLHLVNSCEDGQEHSRIPRGQYGWNYQEITQKELPENLVLLGWIRNGDKNDNLYFCDSTASILCLITESEVSESIHKCDSACIMNRHDINSPILHHTKGIKSVCPLPQTTHLGAILKLTSFKIIIETFIGLQPGLAGNDSNTSNTLRNIYLVFSARNSLIIGKIPGFYSVLSSVENVSSITEKTKLNDNKNIPACCYVLLIKNKELQLVNSINETPTLTACVQGYILGKYDFTTQTGKNRHVSSEEFKVVTKREVAIEFTNNCYWLHIIHEGRFYNIVEYNHVNNVCQIGRALESRGKMPVIRMSSNMSLEEVDIDSGMCDDYKDWAQMAEQFVQVNGVRCFLSNWENRELKRNEFGPTNSLVSLRGVILERSTVISNDNPCPFPSIPSGQMFLPRYGFISSSQALSLRLGYCFLGNRTMVLKIRDVMTADVVKLYLDFSTRVYPTGFVPGAVVTFRLLQKHTSKQGNLYLTFEACSSFTIEAVSSSTMLLGTLSNVNITSQDNSFIEQRRIIDFVQFQRQCGKIFFTLSYIFCRIVAIQKVALKWTCLSCGRLPSNCYCHVSKSSQRWVFSAQARCIVEDGTGEAMLFIEEEDLVRKLLFLRESSWLEIKNMARKQGELLYQRSAYWKYGRFTGDSTAERTLSSMIFTPELYRRIKILCKQFQIASIEEKGERTIRVDRKDHTTNILPKVTMNVSEIQEMDYRSEIKSLITMVKNSALNES